MRIATFALFLGLAYISAGVLGLVPAALYPAPGDAPPTRYNVLYGYLLGLFPVNALHSIVHLAIGVWGVLASRRVLSPKLFARALAILYGVLALLGLIPGVNTLFGLLPLHGHDVWLHAATALLAGYFGWRTEHEVERRSNTSPDRRERTVPVPHERRFGHGDRRLPTSEV
jgi:uncharacterized protein DUF4383